MYGNNAAGGGTKGATRPQATRPDKKVTAPALRARKGGDPIAMVTAYDFTMARLCDEGGADALLVGDSLGMVVQGNASTIPVTVEDICYHTRAVARGATVAHVVGDMPFMSFQISTESALVNAGRLVKEGHAESVKLEGGQEIAEHILRITRAGIPVMGHIGLTPQSVHAIGGYRVQGTTPADAQALIADARAVEEAGAFALVLEAIPPDLAADITAAISIPTIGIGAGPSCDGQVLVCYDMLGMTLGRTPKFTKTFTDAGSAITGAVAQYVREIREGSFPAEEHCYRSNASRAPKAQLAIA